MAAAKAFNLYIHTNTDNAPFVRATGVRFFQLNGIIQMVFQAGLR
jgi:hypothetical protein